MHFFFLNNKTTTPYQEDPLWQKLAGFPLDEGFSKRLARENEWGVLFTAQVIGEYRRFLYLTEVAGHPVTPSKAIDLKFAFRAVEKPHRAVCANGCSKKPVATLVVALHIMRPS